MKKFFLFLIFIVFFIIFTLLVYISTNCHETDKFNNFIIKEFENINPNVKLKVNKIKVKLDIKKLNLFLSTNNLKINIQDFEIPVSKLKIYVKFLPLIKSELKLKKLTAEIDEISITNFQKIAIRIKPSNFKTFLLNNVYEGSLKTKIELDYDSDFRLINYNIAGSIKNTNINYNKKFKLNNVNFNFVTSKKKTKIENISINYKSIPFTKGIVNIENDDDLIISGSIITNVKATNEQLKKVLPDFTRNNFFNNNFLLLSNLNNKFYIKLNKTFKLLDYNYELNAKINNTKIDLKENIKNPLLKNEIKKFQLDKSNLKIKLNKNNKNSLNFKGLYQINNNSNFKKFIINTNLSKKNSFFKINLEFEDEVHLEILNYQKEKYKNADILAEFSLIKNKLKIKKFEYIEGKSKIILDGLYLNKNNQILKFKKIYIKTFQNDEENNNLNIHFDKKILIEGTKFDSTNISKQVEKKNKSNFLDLINKNIEINLSHIITDISAPLKNFRLLGQLEKGKFIKISSKSEFSGKKYLDIKMAKIEGTKKKYLEIYSDLPKALLTNYKFFNGINGGTLLFQSTIGDQTTSSLLEINNFNVKNAPAFAKLLTLADFGGVADLLSGEGISFDILEIKTFTDNKKLSIDEIFVSGPSISILMDGYIEEETGLLSLRGTMIPAKQLNNLISKIPVLGKILIPKQAGEGLFGVSFKMKGEPGKIKTTVNPIKTLTPRFITKALEKYSKN